MKDLTMTRENINKIDKEIAKLFEERMNLCKDIAEYKKENSLPIYDANREDSLINNNLNLINDENIKPYYVSFLKSLLNVSKEYQRSILTGLKISYSGIEGAYGYIAASRMYPNCELISNSNFTQAFKSVEKGICDRAVLPIENSFAGDVGEVMDLIFSGSLYINRMYDLEVEHNLMANENVSIEDIKIVVSHPQALAQCSKFIEENNFKTIEEVNTAFAAKRLSDSKDKNMAVIASKETADAYGLKILKESINNSGLNTTRFASFSRVMSSYKNIGASKKNFVIVFTVKNVAGALAKCLDIIGAHGFNMRNLRSRPMKDLMWTYYFFCEIEGDLESDDAKNMFVALNTFCDRLKIVGNYII
ncbi:MAG: chorismate mutase [Lachnospiraceae bacterium]|nr:chorismate mutase [Lachnospiraceae bacterium]